MQFFHQVLPMLFDGFDADAELRRDLLVDMALRYYLDGTGTLEHQR